MFIQQRSHDQEAPVDGGAARKSRRCDFGFWILDFGLRNAIQRPIQRPIQNPKSKIQNARLPRGFSILELMLVLALLVAITSVAAPTLFKPLDSYRLKTSAEDVRRVWSRARTRAMRNGKVYAFQCVLQTGNFRLQPLTTLDGVMESADGATVVMAGDGVENGTLGDRVVFSALVRQHEPRAELTLSVSTADAMDSAGQWSESILFYPDGTSSTAQVQIQNHRGRSLVVQLRGIVGTSSVDETAGQQ